MGNFAVYVYDERGQPHHLPHAHIKAARTTGGLDLPAVIGGLTITASRCRGP